MLLLLAEILMVGVTADATVNVNALEVMVAGMAHAADDVTWQVTTSLLAGDASVNPDWLVPALLPFTFHW